MNMAKLQLAIMAFASVVVANSARASFNLITDGDFSTPGQGVGGYTYAPTGSPWTFSPLIGGVSGSGITYIPSAFENTPLNIQAGFLQTAGGSVSSTDPASISQVFSAPAAGSYDLSFMYAGRTYDGGTTTFKVSVDGSSVFTVTPLSGQNFTPESLIVTLANGNHTLAFTSTAPVIGYDETAFIGNVSLTAVPEPTTIISAALMLLPFGASTLRILRRKQVA
jgi:hypothetical protein